ncbi:MAG: DUF2846 domain-containing protein [Pseudomonadota bacterium]
MLWRALPRKRATVCYVFFALLAACTTSDPASEAADSAAKRFEPPLGMAHLYIYRDDNVLINTAISISVDGDEIGRTGNGTFLLSVVKPGAHRIIAKGENTDELVVDAQAGENVFVQLGVGLGAFTNRANLILMDEKQGKAAVAKTRLLK